MPPVDANWSSMRGGNTRPWLAEVREVREQRDNRRNYQRNTRLPVQSGPSRTYLHSGFRVVSRSDLNTSSNVTTCSRAHSK